MMLKNLTCALLLTASLTGCAQLDQIFKKSREIAGDNKKQLTNEEVISGLKEALSVGTTSASAKAGQEDGFFGNPKLFIPWPEEARKMKDRLLLLGFTSQVNDFEKSLNRAAEAAAKEAKPVFIDAIKKMTVADGFAILRGSDTAATNYLRRTTYDPLYDKFLPVVKEAIAKVNVTKYWNPLVTAYNRIPGASPQNPDLDDYVTRRAINGLMLLIADEEQKIRKDPAARVTDILRKVFG